VAVGKLRVVAVDVKVFVATTVGTTVEVGVLALMTVTLGTGVRVAVAEGIF
jgi:hypothetical protein